MLSRYTVSFFNVSQTCCVNELISLQVSLRSAVGINSIFGTNWMYKVCRYYEYK